MISNLATDYIQKRTGQALLFSFEYDLLPNLISELLGQLDPNHETSGARASSVVSSGIKDTLGQQIRPGTLYEVLMALKERER